MTKQHVLLVALAGLASACASPRPIKPPPELIAERESFALIETSPANSPTSSTSAPSTSTSSSHTVEITETERRAWIDAQRPLIDENRPPVVERVIVREPVTYVREPVYVRERYVHDPGCDGWALPISLSLGYWSGWGRHHHGRHGWGVGFGLHDRWCW